MALQQSFDLNGLPAPVAYRRVERVALVRADKQVIIDVSTYADAAHKNGLPIDSQRFVLRNIQKVLNPDGSTAVRADRQYDDFLADAVTGALDPYALAYRALKKLSAFAGSSDVA